jgi:hypothetical protein
MSHFRRSYTGHRWIGRVRPVDRPPIDEKTISTLIERLQRGDADARLRAKAALLAIGRPAVPPLEAARRAARDTETAVRFAMLKSDIQRR